MAKDTIESLLSEMKQVHHQLVVYSEILFEKRVVRFLKAFANDRECFQSERDLKVAQKIVAAVELRKVVTTDEKLKASLTYKISDLLDILDF